MDAETEKEILVIWRHEVFVETLLRCQEKHEKRKLHNGAYESNTPHQGSCAWECTLDGHDLRNTRGSR